VFDAGSNSRSAPVPQQEIGFTKPRRTRNQFDHHTIGEDFTSADDAAVCCIRPAPRIRLCSSSQSNFPPLCGGVHDTHSLATAQNQVFPRTRNVNLDFTPAPAVVVLQNSE
jgi:hypothetical protein